MLNNNNATNAIRDRVKKEEDTESNVHVIYLYLYTIYTEIHVL